MIALSKRLDMMSVNITSTQDAIRFYAYKLHDVEGCHCFIAISLLIFLNVPLATFNKKCRFYDNDSIN